MSSFCYEAVDGVGLKMNGTIEVSDQNEALRRIREMGLFPVKVFQPRVQWRRSAVAKKKSSAARMEINIPFFSGRVKAKYVTAFTRQLATLTDAGMPLLR